MRPQKLPTNKKTTNKQPKGNIPVLYIQFPFLLLMSEQPTGLAPPGTEQHSQHPAVLHQALQLGKAPGSVLNPFFRASAWSRKGGRGLGISKKGEKVPNIPWSLHRHHLRAGLNLSPSKPSIPERCSCCPNCPNFSGRPKIRHPHPSSTSSRRRRSSRRPGAAPAGHVRGREMQSTVIISRRALLMIKFGRR